MSKPDNAWATFNRTRGRVYRCDGTPPEKFKGAPDPVLIGPECPECGHNNFHNAWLCRCCGHPDTKTWAEYIRKGYIKRRKNA